MRIYYLKLFCFSLLLKELDNFIYCKKMPTKDADEMANSEDPNKTDCIKSV